MVEKMTLPALVAFVERKKCLKETFELAVKIIIGFSSAVYISDFDW